MSGISYTVIRSAKRRRTVSLSISPIGGLRITAPFGSRLEIIEKIIQRRSAWIMRKIELLKQHRRTTYVQKFIDGAEISYRGQACLLRINHGNSSRSKCSYSDNVIEVSIPDANISGKELCAEARLEIVLWYKKQARREFQERLAYWAEKLGVSFGRVIVSNPSRRWGSCNSKNDIRLNWRLIMAEPALLDYVAAHELCHVVHKNHARAFWNLLGSVMPDYKSRRMQLRAWERSGKFEL